MALGDGVISGFEFPHLVAVSALYPLQPRVATGRERAEKGQDSGGIFIHPSGFSEIGQNSHTCLHLTILQLFKVGLEINVGFGFSEILLPQELL